MPNAPQNPSANAVDHNKEIASKLAQQDISGQSTIADSTDAESTLDALMKQAEEAATKKAEQEPTTEPEPVVEPKGEDEVKPEGEAKPDAEVKPEGEVKPDAEPKPPVEDPNKKLADEIFKDSPSLPAGASPKSADAFSSVKIKAAQEISTLRKQVDDLTKQTTELSDKLKNPVPEEITRELTELRQFRAKIDVELDPKFKEYDKSISNAQEFIYAQLRKSPQITDDIIKEIKKHGGPENVKLEKLFSAINDPTIQRLVEAKVADIEHSKFNRDQAIKSARENIGQYLVERDKQFKDATTSHNTSTKSQLEKMTAQLDWFKEKQIPTGADEATKKELEGHNKFVKDTKAQLEDAVNDDSPEMRAIMLVGMAQLFQLQRTHAASAAKITALEKQVADANALVERLKASSRSRLPSNAPPAGKVSDSPKNGELNLSARTGDVLDDLAKKVMEERERARAGA